MGTLIKSENTDEIPNDAAFHQGLHCLAKARSILKERNTFFFFWGGGGGGGGEYYL